VFFFFQAEDGIRDWSVTGVQLCALPISLALLHNTDLEARDIAEKALLIAGDICVFTNQNITIEEL